MEIIVGGLCFLALIGFLLAIFQDWLDEKKNKIVAELYRDKFIL